MGWNCACDKGGALLSGVLVPVNVYDCRLRTSACLDECSDPDATPAVNSTKACEAACNYILGCVVLFLLVAVELRLSSRAIFPARKAEPWVEPRLTRLLVPPRTARPAEPPRKSSLFTKSPATPPRPSSSSPSSFLRHRLTVLIRQILRRHFERRRRDGLDRLFLLYLTFLATTPGNRVGAVGGIGGSYRRRTGADTIDGEG
jgi:hypothetical protein